jgi:putative membrane protein
MTMRTGLRPMVVSCVLILSCGCSKTDGTGTPGSEPPAARGIAVGTGGAGANVKTDAEFVDDVASKLMAEVELSRMALDRSANRQIKAFAQMLIDDFTAAENTLKSDVSGRGIEWPARLGDAHRDTASDLEKKHGPEFDRDYAEAMVEVQQDLAAKLESRLDVQSVAAWKTAAAGRTQTQALPDPAVAMPDVPVRPNQSDSEITMKINRWAADTYPVAQKHLDTARTLANATEDVRQNEGSRRPR